MSEVVLYRNRDWLEEKYIHERLQVREMAESCGVAECTISRWIRKFGIYRSRIYLRTVVSKVRELKSTEAAYLAACVDTDGSVFFRRNGGSYIDVGNTDLEFLEFLQQMCGGGRLTEKKYSRKNGYKPFYQLRFRVKETFDLLPQIIPFMIIKKGKAQCLLEHMRECLLQK